MRKILSLHLKAAFQCFGCLMAMIYRSFNGLSICFIIPRFEHTSHHLHEKYMENCVRFFNFSIQMSLGCHQHQNIVLDECSKSRQIAHFQAFNWALKLNLKMFVWRQSDSSNCFIANSFFVLEGKKIEGDKFAATYFFLHKVAIATVPQSLHATSAEYVRIGKCIDINCIETYDMQRNDVPSQFDFACSSFSFYR